jgi:preprotein translocase subunit SecG
MFWNNKILKRISIWLVTLFFLAPISVGAADLQSQVNDQLSASAGGAHIGDALDPRLVAASIIQVVLSLLGTVFFILLVMSGYWLITARGDESKVEKAQATIRSAIIGLAIVLMAYGITLFVTSRVFVANGSTSGSSESRGLNWSFSDGIQTN